MLVRARLRLASSGQRRAARRQLHHGIGELRGAATMWSSPTNRFGRRASASSARQCARNGARAPDAGDVARRPRTRITRGGEYREALAWTHRTKPDAGLEGVHRLNFARLHLEERQFLEAEQENPTRRAARDSRRISSGVCADLQPCSASCADCSAMKTGSCFFNKRSSSREMLELFGGRSTGVLRVRTLSSSRGPAGWSARYLERARELFELAELVRIWIGWRVSCRGFQREVGMGGARKRHDVRLELWVGSSEVNGDVRFCAL